MNSLVVLYFVGLTSAWSPIGWRIRSSVSCSAVVSRRISLIAGPVILCSALEPTIAAEVPTAEELTKLTRGYERLQELLNNWDSITLGACRGSASKTSAQVIATNGGACDKAPLKIQEYIGYKSINDPLFKAEKLMQRALPLVDPNAVDEYLEYVNLWAEKAQMSSLNAYTSSWGEANPNGGQTVVAAFLDDAKYDVEESASILAKILKYLDLPTTTTSASSST